MFSANRGARAYLKEGNCEWSYLDGVFHEIEAFYRRRRVPPDFEI